METAYNEEELLLRLLVGIVFPVLILVILRMTIFGLRNWEKQWRSPATSWLTSVIKRGGLPDPEGKAYGLVAFLLGLERVVAFFVAVVPLSVAWFILFPQTRSLAQEFVQGIVAPILDLLSAILRGLLLVVYSAALFVGALITNRFLTRRIKEKHPDSILALPLFSVPLRIGVWLLAVFLFLLPYPGLPRIFAVGLLLLIMLLGFFALRPIIEELAIGVYLHAALGFVKGAAIVVDGVAYTIADLTPLHALLEKDGERLYLPYSRIMRSATSKTEAAHNDES